MALEEEGFKIINNITWQKTNPPPNLDCKTFTHSTETILWARKDLPKIKYRFNYDLMKELNNNKQMKDVWTTSLTKPSEKKQGKHPTQKPLEILETIILASTYDYVLGVECGLNSNARKNRGGHLMEDLVEKFIQKAGFKKNETYFKEMYLQDIENRWKLDMSFISNKNQATKRFDFFIRTDKCIYGIETNFYASGGSKLNETARSYKMIAEEADKVVGFEFVWFTDGIGWISARNNLRETFDNMEHIYNIADIKEGIIETKIV